MTQKQQDILNIVSLGIGIIGFALSIYFYYDSLRTRQPTFFIHPIKTVLVDKNLIQDKPLHIFDDAGKEIKDNIIITTFSFFNQGNESIKKENVLNPIIITVGNCKAFQPKILKVSRPLIDLQLKQIDTTWNRILVDFKILEEKDGFTAQVVTVGDEPTLTIQGDIEGVKKTELGYFKPTYKYVLIAFGVLFAGFFFGYIYIIERFLRRIPKYKPFIRLIIYTIVLMLFIGMAFIFYDVEVDKKLKSEKLLPSEILP